jgi:hypothetical protein
VIDDDILACRDVRAAPRRAAGTRRLLAVRNLQGFGEQLLFTS